MWLDKKELRKLFSEIIKNKLIGTKHNNRVITDTIACANAGVPQPDYSQNPTLVEHLTLVADAF